VKKPIMVKLLPADLLVILETAVVSVKAEKAHAMEGHETDQAHVQAVARVTLDALEQWLGNKPIDTTEEILEN